MLLLCVLMILLIAIVATCISTKFQQENMQYHIKTKKDFDKFIDNIAENDKNFPHL